MIVIVPLTREDYTDVSRIYREGIATGIATLETESPDWQKWDADHLTDCRLVAKENDVIVGWAALTKVSGRCVYNGVAEVSVYVGDSMRGKGVGTHLLSALIDESERHGYWTLQSGIFAENTASIRLHERCGFRIVGVRERIGMRDGIWKDIVLMERRSAVAGV